METKFTMEKFLEMSNWSFEDNSLRDGVFENIVMFYYGMYRINYNSDEEWYHAKHNDLISSRFSFEAGWYRSAYRDMREKVERLEKMNLELLNKLSANEE